MAQLHFYYGTMGSSKSAALIMNAFNYKKNGIKTQVIKPSFDKRFSQDKIVSRIGIETDALSMPNLSKYVPETDTKILFVDEVQFFKPSDIDNLVHIADNLGIIVICYGLMTDSNEHIFPSSARLIEVGAKLHLLQSNCQINGCLKPATHHLRFNADGNVITQGAQLELGDTKYKSVCRQHFNELYHSKTK
jgi:thymidine kinase